MRERINRNRDIRVGIPRRMDVIRGRGRGDILRIVAEEER